MVKNDIHFYSVAQMSKKLFLFPLEGVHGVGKSSIISRFMLSGCVTVLREDFLETVSHTDITLADQITWCLTWYARIKEIYHGLEDGSVCVVVTDRCPLTSLLYCANPLQRTLVAHLLTIIWKEVMEECPGIVERKIFLFKNLNHVYINCLSRLEYSDHRKLRKALNEDSIPHLDNMLRMYVHSVTIDDIVVDLEDQQDPETEYCIVRDVLQKKLSILSPSLSKLFEND